MRGVFSRSWRACVACLLVVVLLGPAAFASDGTDASLWAEFRTWLQGRLNIPGGVAVADEDGFTVWLMARLGVPNG